MPVQRSLTKFAPRHLRARNEKGVRRRRQLRRTAMDPRGGAMPVKKSASISSIQEVQFREEMSVIGETVDASHPKPLLRGGEDVTMGPVAALQARESNTQHRRRSSLGDLTMTSILSAMELDDVSAKMEEDEEAKSVDFADFPINVLRGLCRTLSIPAKGKKVDLVERLHQHVTFKKTHSVEMEQDQEGEEVFQTASDVKRSKASSSKDGAKQKRSKTTSSTSSSAPTKSTKERDLEEKEEDEEAAQEHVLAAGVTHVPQTSETGYEIAELHEYDLHESKWKSPSALIRIKIEAKPFQKGAMRNAYKAKVLERPDTDFVVKDYIDENTRGGYYYKDVQMQEASAYYARAMTKYIDARKCDEELTERDRRTLGQCFPLTFNDTFLIKIPSTGKLYVAEYFMEGTYTKFNNNFGYVADRGDFINDYAQAFSHFTLHQSKGSVLICDIQGTDQVYTDPQIHTSDKDKGFGQGNLNDEGIEKFKETHVCNRVCRALGLAAFTKKSKRATGGKGKSDGADAKK